MENYKGDSKYLFAYSTKRSLTPIKVLYDSFTDSDHAWSTSEHDNQD